MAVTIRAEDYAKLAAHLKSVDRKTAAAIRKRLRMAAAPLGQAILEEGGRHLPERGGLRRHVMASDRAAASLTRSGLHLNLRSKGAAINYLDAGQVRHPLFGMRKADTSTIGKRARLAVTAKRKRKRFWFTTEIDASKYSEEFQRRADEVRYAILKIIEDVVPS